MIAYYFLSGLTNPPKFSTKSSFFSDSQSPRNMNSQSQHRLAIHKKLYALRLATN